MLLAAKYPSLRARKFLSERIEGAQVLRGNGGRGFDFDQNLRLMRA